MIIGLNFFAEGGIGRHSRLGLGWSQLRILIFLRIGFVMATPPINVTWIVIWIDKFDVREIYCNFGRLENLNWCKS